MNFTKLVPNIFYKDIRSGLKIFVNCLEFIIGLDELKSNRPFCVLEKDGLRVNLFQEPPTFSASWRIQRAKGVRRNSQNVMAYFK